jgi:hypothetical protein
MNDSASAVWRNHKHFRFEISRLMETYLDLDQVRTNGLTQNGYSLESELLLTQDAAVLREPNIRDFTGPGSIEPLGVEHRAASFIPPRRGTATEGRARTGRASGESSR